MVLGGLCLLLESHTCIRALMGAAAWSVNRKIVENQSATPVEACLPHSFDKALMLITSRLVPSLDHSCPLSLIFSCGTRSNKVRFSYGRLTKI